MIQRKAIVLAKFGVDDQTNSIRRLFLVSSSHYLMDGRRSTGIGTFQKTTKR